MSKPTNPGKVYLVGGGPGDPGLLTVRARELFELCDVICYDELISTAILSLAPAGKPLLPTGYRGYRGGHIEYGMHPEVIEQALAGRSVLRLKAGDPFIFGRATEECAELDQHGIDYEVVPGITAALGAATYAGFPLTSAGMASDVTLASGHRSSKTITSWASLGSSTGTLVLYMGAKKLAEHARLLIELGRDSNTPVAHISSATTAQQIVTVGTLDTIGEQVLALNNSAPALVIMGDVVSLSEKMDWRARLPFSGKPVLLCGEVDAELERSLRQAGAVVTCAPKVHTSLAIAESDWADLEQANKLVFADARAVQSWWTRLLQQGRDLRTLTQQFYVTSREAQEALNQLGFFAVQQVDCQHLPEGGLLLGQQGRARVGAWCQRASELQFPLEIPALVFVSSQVACERLWAQQPEVLKQATQVMVSDTTLLEWLAQRGVSATLLDLDSSLNAVVNSTMACGT